MEMVIMASEISIKSASIGIGAACRRVAAIAVKIDLLTIG